MNKTDQKVEELREILDTETKASLARIEEQVMMRPLTLGDLMREGSRVTEHSTTGWGDGEKACALHAAVIAARARNII